MALYDRLLGRDDAGVGVANKIGVHAFMAALGELERGKVTRQNLIDYFVLDAGEAAELDTLTAKVMGFPDQISLGGMVTLTNVGTAFDGSVAARGLGIARIECAGISGIEFGVRYDKVGTGTLTFQLWDETGAAEVIALDDTGAAGTNKSMVNTRAFSPSLTPGVRTLRVRCKSTVASDDPVFLGAAIRIVRNDMLFAEAVHEVLLLAESGAPTYDTPSEVKTRLGV